MVYSKKKSTRTVRISNEYEMRRDRFAEELLFETIPSNTHNTALYPSLAKNVHTIWRAIKYSDCS